MLDQIGNRFDVMCVSNHCFLKYATDRPNGVNEQGFARLAHEPFKWNEDVMKFDEVFS